jgi:hypothetical protein
MKKQLLKERFQQLAGIKELSPSDAEKITSQGGFTLELEDNENEALLILQKAINKKSPELGKQFMQLMRDAFEEKK